MKTNNQKTAHKTIVRQVLPNDFEFEKRDSINKQSIKVSLPVSEAVRVRAFTKSETASLDGIKTKERDDFKDFCIKYPQFKGIFYAQLYKGVTLNDKQLDALDYIQDINESDRRIIYQKSARTKQKDFEDRINNFISKNKGKMNIPLLDLDADDFIERQVLRNKVEWLLKNDFKNVAVIFRGRLSYKKSWYVTLPRLAENDIETYVFEVPTKKDNGYSQLFFPFFMGATKVSHIRKFGWGGQVLFLDRDWSKKPIGVVSNGLADYNGQNRKQFLLSDGRKSTIYPFSKWDTIVQANEFCRADLTIRDLTRVPILKQVIRNFS